MFRALQTCSHTVILGIGFCYPPEQLRGRTLPRRFVLSMIFIESWRGFGCDRMDMNHSHSIVPGGLHVTSYTTRLTPFTSLMIRVAVSPRNFMSKG